MDMEMQTSSLPRAVHVHVHVHAHADLLPASSTLCVGDRRVLSLRLHADCKKRALLDLEQPLARHGLLVRRLGCGQDIRHLWTLCMYVCTCVCMCVCTCVCVCVCVCVSVCMAAHRRVGERMDQGLALLIGTHEAQPPLPPPPHDKAAPSRLDVADHAEPPLRESSALSTCACTPVARLCSDGRVQKLGSPLRKQAAGASPTEGDLQPTRRMESDAIDATLLATYAEPSDAHLHAECRREGDVPVLASQ